MRGPLCWSWPTKRFLGGRGALKMLMSVSSVPSTGTTDASVQDLVAGVLKKLMPTPSKQGSEVQPTPAPSSSTQGLPEARVGLHHQPKIGTPAPPSSVQESQGAQPPSSPPSPSSEDIVLNDEQSTALIGGLFALIFGTPEPKSQPR